MPAQCPDFSRLSRSSQLGSASPATENPSRRRPNLSVRDDNRRRSRRTVVHPLIVPRSAQARPTPPTRGKEKNLFSLAPSLYPLPFVFSTILRLLNGARREVRNCACDLFATTRSARGRFRSRERERGREREEERKVRKEVEVGGGRKKWRRGRRGWF